MVKTRSQTKKDLLEKEQTQEKKRRKNEEKYSSNEMPLKF